MKVHEYQARELLDKAGVPVPAGSMVQTVDEAAARASELLHAGNTQVVIKAQVHAGGRGKAGFVKLCKSVDEIREAAEFMLSNRMVSPQTGPEGLDVKRLLVAAAVDIAKEYYLAITVDRARNTNTMIASSEGGVEIEAVAARSPEAIHKMPFHPLIGLQAFQARALAYRLGFEGKIAGQAVKIMLKLARVFLDTDASLAEINPLVLTEPAEGMPEGQLLAIDAKFSFDDSGLFRHPDITDMFDPTEENQAELRANSFGLSYVALDGNIGCLVNGAGLAMSTMDTIKYYGGEPANFLDVGGGASQEAVTKAFRIILQSDAVQGIFVNIFGGIMRCDTIANGVVAATKELGLQVPLVVRLEGTKVEEGRKILDESGLAITSAATMAEGAQTIVDLAKG